MTCPTLHICMVMQNHICSLAEQGLICFTSQNSALICFKSPKQCLNAFISRSVPCYGGIKYQIVPKTNTVFSYLPSICRNFTVFGLNGTVRDSRWSAELHFQNRFGGLEMSVKSHMVLPAGEGENSIPISSAS